jgi:hypothetical protein
MDAMILFAFFLQALQYPIMCLHPQLFQRLIFVTWRGKVMKFENILHDDLAGQFSQNEIETGICSAVVY